MDRGAATVCKCIVSTAPNQGAVERRDLLRGQGRGDRVQGRGNQAQSVISIMLLEAAQRVN